MSLVNDNPAHHHPRTSSMILVLFFLPLRVFLYMYTSNKSRSSQTITTTFTSVQLGATRESIKRVSSERGLKDPRSGGSSLVPNHTHLKLNLRFSDILFTSTATGNLLRLGYL